MKANEFRRNNLLKFKDDEMLVVTGVGYNHNDEDIVYFSPYRKNVTLEEVKGKSTLRDTMYSIMSNVQPIPLTEEWLVKFGFKKDEYYNAIVKQPIELHVQDNIYWCDILWNSMEIKHVHQLQNLFFALTGEELIIDGKG
jgi:hypothetical protein